MTGERLLGIAGHRLEQRLLVAALGNSQRHRRSPQLPSHAEYSSGSLLSIGTRTCFGYPTAGSSEYTPSRILSISSPSVEILDLVDDEPPSPHHTSAPHEEDLHRRLELVVV